jgi:hypothetical protein
MVNIFLRDAKTLILDTDSYMISTLLAMNLNFGVFWRILYGVT